MPAHGRGTRPPSIVRDGDRFHVDDLVLYMQGRWELRFALRHAGHDDEALVTVDVPPRERGAASGLGAGLATTFLPPIDGFGLNAVAATGLTTFLAFTR